jgi:hypothetical protein
VWPHSSCDDSSVYPPPQSEIELEAEDRWSNVGAIGLVDGAADELAHRKRAPGGFMLQDRVLAGLEHHVGLDKGHFHMCTHVEPTPLRRERAKTRARM